MRLVQNLYCGERFAYRGFERRLYFIKFGDNSGLILIENLHNLQGIFQNCSSQSVIGLGIFDRGPMVLKRYYA